MKQLKEQDFTAIQANLIFLIFGHIWPLRWGLFVLTPGFSFPQVRGPIWESEVFLGVCLMEQQMVPALALIAPLSGAVF